MKLEDILKAQGWTDADIAALAPMLADQRFRTSMEQSYGALATERDQLKEKDGKWQQQLDNEWQPRVTKVEQEAIEARRQLAMAQEELKIAKDYGYLPAEAEAKVAAAKAKLEESNNGLNPKDYVSMADAQRMLEAEGRAIAMAADINNEYSRLTGNSLYDYETEIDGRMMRGLSALREEAKQKRMNLDQYVGQKFDFQGKRAAMKAKAQQDRDDQIRKEAADQTRKELAEQYGNPLMRTAVPSRHAEFIPKPANGKQPWEENKQQLKANRIERAMKAQMGVAPN